MPDESISTCRINGTRYEDLSLVPSTNASDPCEVCHCYVSVYKIMQLYTTSKSTCPIMQAGLYSLRLCLQRSHSAFLIHYITKNLTEENLLGLERESFAV